MLQIQFWSFSGNNN